MTPATDRGTSRPCWLYEWFAFGAFASWTSALPVASAAAPPAGRWATADAARAAPLLGLLMAAAAATPLFLRTLLSRRRAYRRRVRVPLALGLSVAPLVGGTLWLAEAVCRPAALDAVALAATLGWPAVLGEAAYRACRTA